MHFIKFIIIHCFELFNFMINVVMKYPTSKICFVPNILFDYVLSIISFGYYVFTYYLFPINNEDMKKN